MILVTGASGKTGRAVVAALLKDSQRVRALVHRPEQAEEMQSLGTEEAIAGDMRSDAIANQAMQGVESVYHICPNVNLEEVPIGRTMIDAALAAGVGRFVYHSVLHPQVEDMPHHWLKMRVEEALFKSGLSYTVLQPAAYMQNVLGEWESITQKGVYGVPYSVSTPMSLVDLEDVAEIAKLVLTESNHAGSIYELAGSQVLTPEKVAETFGKLLGKRVRADRVSTDAWVRRAAASGLGAYQTDTLVKMFDYYDKYGFCGNPLVLETLLGRSPTTFEQFASRTLAAKLKKDG